MNSHDYSDFLSRIEAARSGPKPQTVKPCNKRALPKPSVQGMFSMLSLLDGDCPDYDCSLDRLSFTGRSEPVELQTLSDSDDSLMFQLLAGFVPVVDAVKVKALTPVSPTPKKVCASDDPLDFDNLMAGAFSVSEGANEYSVPEYPITDDVPYDDPIVRPDGSVVKSVIVALSHGSVLECLAPAVENGSNIEPGYVYKVGPIGIDNLVVNHLNVLTPDMVIRSEDQSIDAPIQEEEFMIMDDGDGIAFRNMTGAHAARFLGLISLGQYHDSSGKFIVRPPAFGFAGMFKDKYQFISVTYGKHFCHHQDVYEQHWPYDEPVVAIFRSGRVVKAGWGVKGLRVREKIHPNHLKKHTPSWQYAILCAWTNGFGVFGKEDPQIYDEDSTSDPD